MKIDFDGIEIDRVGWRLARTQTQIYSNAEKHNKFSHYSWQYQSLVLYRRQQ